MSEVSTSFELSTVPDQKERDWLINDLKNLMPFVERDVSARGINYDHELVAMIAKLTLDSHDLMPATKAHLIRMIAVYLDLIAPANPHPPHGLRTDIRYEVRSALDQFSSFDLETTILPPAWSAALEDNVTLYGDPDKRAGRSK